MWATGRSLPPAPRFRSGNAGFTLIEALVVVAVAGLVSGIMFPSLERSIGYWQFRSSAVTVQAALERSRAEALRQARSTRFAPSPSGTGYMVSGEAAGELPASIRIAAAGGRAVDFYRDGSSNGGGIELAGAGRKIRFAVSPDTGLTGIVE